MFSSLSTFQNPRSDMIYSRAAAEQQYHLVNNIPRLTTPKTPQFDPEIPQRIQPISLSNIQQSFLSLVKKPQGKSDSREKYWRGSSPSEEEEEDHFERQNYESPEKEFRRGRANRVGGNGLSGSKEGRERLYNRSSIEETGRWKTERKNKRNSEMLRNDKEEERERNYMEELIEELKKRLVNAEVENGKMRQEMMDLEDKRAMERMEQENEKDAQIAQMGIELERMRREIMLVKCERDQFDKELQLTSSSLEAARFQGNSLQEEVNLFREENERLLREMEDEKRRLSRKCQELDEACFSATEEQINTISSHERDLRELVKEKQEIEEHFRKEILKQNELVQEFEEELIAKDQVIKQSEQELMRLNQELKKCFQIIEDREEKLIQVNNALFKSQDERECLQRQNFEMNELNSLLRRQLTKERQGNSTGVEGLTYRIVQLEEELKKTDLKYKNAERLIMELEANQNEENSSKNPRALKMGQMPPEDSQEGSHFPRLSRKMRGRITEKNSGVSFSPNKII